jgi:8-oxo-dGTP diphosphatase
MLEVAAAIIKEGEQFLICQRAKEDECALLWEFPGGKREAGETLEDCAVRELKEELDVDIRVLEMFDTALYCFEDKEVFLTFFKAEIIGGDLTLKVHKEIQWVTRKELKKFNFMPANIEILERIIRGD